MAKCAASEFATASPLSPQALKHLTLFCDFDGPIVDVSDRYYHTYRLGLTETQAAHPDLRLSPLTKQQFWQMKQERMPDAEIALRSGLQGEQIDRFLQRVVQIVNQPALLQQDQLQPGVKWALALLHAQGVRLVLVTLRCQAQATQILQDHGLVHLFSQIWGSVSESIAYSNLAEHKTELLRQAIAMQQNSSASYATFPDSAWMIGDTEADVLAGQAMDVPTIALTCGIRSQTYLQKFEPTRIHSDLLSAAHYLVRHTI
ncbi:HAD family hydrolase [Phormidium tenue FACHB-886]|nr:HAD family hydrolase [Phormidium tenue FACHB-886]